MSYHDDYWRVHQPDAPPAPPEPRRVSAGAWWRAAFRVLEHMTAFAACSWGALVLHATGQTTPAYIALAMAGIALVLAALVRPGP
jgi:hypothetical protein